MTDQIRVQVTLTGRVQGVSFRATTQDQANRLNLTGWVKNLASGQVQLEAQGQPKDIEHLLHWLKGGPPLAQVKQLNKTALPSLSEEKGFHILG